MVALISLNIRFWSSPVSRPILFLLSSSSCSGDRYFLTSFISFRSLSARWDTCILERQVFRIICIPRFFDSPYCYVFFTQRKCGDPVMAVVTEKFVFQTLWLLPRLGSRLFSWGTSKVISGVILTYFRYAGTLGNFYEFVTCDSFDCPLSIFSITPLTTPSSSHC